jgi:arabinose-5-phosphate isomerase
MEREEDFLTVRVADVMTAAPRTTEPDQLAASAVGVMERHGVMALPVLEAGRKVVGMVHLHDLMRAGVV